MKVEAFILFLMTYGLCSLVSAASSDLEVEVESSSNFQIEGKVAPPDFIPKDWYWTTKIYLEGGKRMGYLKDDNSFVITGLPSGTYLLEVLNPDYYYESVRVDINSKGKVRARKVNNVQPKKRPAEPDVLHYPLQLKSLGRFKYFQAKEEWKVTDILMNPTVIMMVLPLLLIKVLPKMMNNP